MEGLFIKSCAPLRSSKQKSGFLGFIGAACIFVGQLGMAQNPPEFDASVLPSERRIVREDLQLIQSLQSEDFEMDDLQNRSKALQALRRDPQAWLYERVKYIVGPINRSGLFATGANSFMINVGALLSPRNGSPASSFRFNSTRLLVESPSIGLIQFLKEPSTVTLISSLGARALPNQIYRLAALFHDARHSDGKTEDPGIPHIKCPSNHTAAQLIQCDRYIDASFGTEVFIGKALVKRYAPKLTDEEKKQLLDWLSLRKTHIVGDEIYE